MVTGDQTCISPGGAGPAGLYRNVTKAGESPRFSVVNDSGADLTGATGAYPLDVDGDGTVDLAVLRIGGNVLLRGLGGCRFERANERWGFDGGDRITMAFSATWEGSAALPTLAFGNYISDPDPQDPDHLLRGQRPRQTRGRRHPVRRPHPADPVLVRPLDALQRLGSVGPPGPSDQQRSALLQRPERRAGPAVADRAGRGAPAVHR